MATKNTNPKKGNRKSPDKSKTSDNKQVEVKGKEKKRSEITNGKISNETMTGVQIMDSQWFTSIFRNEGFSVRGYFKMQHKKNERGEWIRELIYINL